MNFCNTLLYAMLENIDVPQLTKVTDIDHQSADSVTPVPVPSAVSKLWKPINIVGFSRQSIVKVKGHALLKAFRLGAHLCKRPRDDLEEEPHCCEESSETDDSSIQNNFMEFIAGSLKSDEAINILRTKRIIELRHVCLDTAHVLDLLRSFLGDQVSSPTQSVSSSLANTCVNLLTLDLESNAIGDEIINTLEQAVASGYFPAMRNLYLASNRLTGKAVDVMVECGAQSINDANRRRPSPCLLTQIEDLGMTNNALGHASLLRFLKWIAEGKTTLNRLHLNHVCSLDEVAFKECLDAICRFLLLSSLRQQSVVWFKQNMAKGHDAGSVIAAAQQALENSSLASLSV